MNKFMAKKFYSKALLALMLSVGILYVTAFLPVFAEEPSTDFSIEVETSLTIEVSDATVDLALRPGINNGFGSTTTGVTVSTNNLTGYTLTVKASSTDLSDGQSHVIPTLGTGTFTQANFPENKWGINMPASGNGNYVAASTESVLVKQTSKPLVQDVSTIGLAARANMDLPIGTYATTLTFEAIQNELPCEGTKFGGVCITYLQDFYKNTSTIAAAMTEGQVYTFKDKRDNEVYNVKKLADGNIWMVENLRLGGSSAINLTPNDTNIASNWTLPASGTANFDSTNGYTNAAVNADYKTTVQAASGSSPAGKIGNHYNYCAASAGTYCYALDSAPEGTNAEHDICPKGWRMPLGGSSGEYQALYTAYSNNVANFQAALVTPLSGGFSNGSATYQGSNGSFWSSTFYSGSIMYYLVLNSSLVYPMRGGYRYAGDSVRCVAGSTKYMQDVEEWKDELDVGDSVQAVDRRDGEIYAVKKLADGNIWMAENLRLGGSSEINLTPADTNITSNWTLPASGTANFDSTNGYTNAAVNADYKTTEQAANGSSPAGKIGNFYNYCAASARTYCYPSGQGTGNVTHDICPKGWRMPTGGSSSEYNTLYTAYSSNAANFQADLVTPLSGYFLDGSASDQGGDGNFWSSTFVGFIYAYTLRVDSSGVDPTSVSLRYYGNSVRCVAQ